MKKMKLQLLIISVLFTVQSFAQWTTNRDKNVRGQFNVAENGVGKLQPDWYYNTFHQTYKSWAMTPTVNKLFQRTAVKASSTKQRGMAEEIDSALRYRAKVEALNMADRLPELDVSWKVERGKIERKMQLFRENINKITLNGGTAEDYKEWMLVYNCYQFAINTLQTTYMPNQERKKEYVELYREIVLRNNKLVQFIASKQGGAIADRYVHSAVKPSYVRLSGYAAEAYGSWTNAASGGLVKSRKTTSKPGQVKKRK